MGWEAWEPLVKDLRRWKSLRYQERVRIAAIILGWVLLVAVALGFGIVLFVATWEAMSLGL
jgi:hypothetical protein